jgi:hypothetical protein
MLTHLICPDPSNLKESADAITTEATHIPQRRRPQPAKWQKPKRKRSHHGRKDWRRQRLEWRHSDKAQRQFLQRWMKPSKQPGKKPMPVLIQRSRSMPESSLNLDLPLNQIFNLTER